MCIFVAAARINIFSAAHAGKPLAMLARNWTSARVQQEQGEAGIKILKPAMGGRGGRLFRVLQLQLPFPAPPLWSEPCLACHLLLFGGKSYFELSAYLEFLRSPI